MRFPCKLEGFHFGTNFVAWVGRFYKNIQSCVLNNGNSSDYFYGVRQGDPLSSYLFAIAEYILGIPIGQNSQI